MKKLQLSRILMVITILLLALFEGYWLNKLYHDEYANLKKEVDVNFRDAMYKLQRRRFEKDTSLVGQAFESALPVALAKRKPFSTKGGGKGKTVFYYNNSVAVDDLHKMKPEMIESIRVTGDGVEGGVYRGVPPPGLIEVIMKQRAGLPDSGRITLRTDSGFSDNYSMDHSGYKYKISSFMLRKGDGKDSGRVVVMHGDSSGMHAINDSLKKMRGINLVAGKANLNRVATAVKNIRHPDVAFNKVYIMNDDHKGKEPSPMIRFLSNNKTINDSIPVKVVDSAFNAELAKSKKKLPYTILFQKYANANVKKADFEPDTSANVITSKMFVGYTTLYSYQASFDNAGRFIVNKMGMQIGGSALLLLFVMISFITVYRNLVAQQRLTVIKNDFISNITHELKTPIATVNVAIEALRNFGGLQSPERTKEYLDISASELQRLGLLVDKVLKLSMFENHEIALQKESFDLLQLIEEVMASMRLQFEKQHAVTSLKAMGYNFMMDADKLHITSVIYNLLDNALKYSKADPDISVELTRHEEYFELRISDKGIGIPDEYRSKIFDQFFRVPTGDRHNIKGYGLGLSYVNHIVKQHIGFIEVESEEGKGSTFIVRMAVADMPVVHFDKGRKMFRRVFKIKK